MERKAAEKKESRALKRQKKGQSSSDHHQNDDSVETSSGIQIESQRRKAISIGECNDLATLEGMLE